MYQSVIRDPGGDSLIRIRPDVSSRYRAVVNGSKLLVSPGTVAVAAIIGTNDMEFRSFPPGTYDLFTGVGPFFVRLRNIMTGGDTGTSVSVFFVSTEKAKFMKVGTGQFPFEEHRFHITLMALALCSLSISVLDPMTAVMKIAGSYSSSFSGEDIDLCVEQMVMSPVREALSKAMSRLNVAEFNSSLSTIGSQAAQEIRPGLSEYGFSLEQFRISAINVPEAELRRLNSLEEQYASGKTRTDIELDNLQRMWEGNKSDFILSGMLRGNSSGGSDACGGGSASGVMPMMAQMMMLSQLLPMFRESMTGMTGHADIFGHQADRQESPSGPSVPEGYRRCPSCGGIFDGNKSICPACGSVFGEGDDPNDT